MTNGLERPAISLEQVSKVFGKAGGAGTFTAVDALDLEVAQGQMLALLGKTGCGKSTIFNMIAGLTEPTKGRVTVDGHDPFRDFDAFRGKMAIVFQGDRAAAMANGDRECTAWAGDSRKVERGAQKHCRALAGNARTSRA